MSTIRVGCAGWTVPRQHAALFQSDGSHLSRFASTFNCVEVNSSFYRVHQPKTYTRWAASVPDDFLFSVKVPKTVTHERKLVDAGDLMTIFLEGVTNLGTKCGPLLFQLPPSLAFNPEVARRFFKEFRSSYSAAAVCEPRHQSWFTSQACDLLKTFKIGRVAADPSVAATFEPGSYKKTVYYRLHGSPDVYYSSYSRPYLETLIDKLRSHHDAETIWCIFDNTAAGWAVENACYVVEGLRQRLNQVPT